MLGRLKTMKWKGCGRKMAYPVSRDYTGTRLEISKGTTKTLVRIMDSPAKV
jgi:hypothetical protein